MNISKMSQATPKNKKPRVWVNRYQYIKKLGKGNFGTAYLCKDLRHKASDEDGNL